MPWIPNSQETGQILRDANVPTWVPAHCSCVAQFAELIAKRIGRNSDINFEVLEAGCALHDVGRAFTQDPRHGFLGADYLRTLEIDERICRLVETHVGAGLLGPEVTWGENVPRDLIPRTIEEKICAHSDNYFSASKRLTLAELESKYRAKKLNSAFARIEALDAELEALAGAPLATIF